MTPSGLTVLMWWIAPALAAPPAQIELDYAAVANDPWLRRRGLRLSGSVAPLPPLTVGASLLVAPPWSQADLTPLLRDVLERTARRPDLSRVILYAAPEVRFRVLEHTLDDRGSALWLVGSAGLSLTDVPEIDRATLTVDPDQTESGWHGTGSLGMSVQTWSHQWGAQVRVDAQLYAQPYGSNVVWQTPIWLSVGLTRRSKATVASAEP